MHTIASDMPGKTSKVVNSAFYSSAELHTLPWPMNFSGAKPRQTGDRADAPRQAGLKAAMDTTQTSRSALLIYKKL